MATHKPDTTVPFESSTSGANIDAKYKEVVGESGAGTFHKGKEEEIRAGHTAEMAESHQEPKKEGLLQKVQHFFTGKTDEALSEEELRLREKERQGLELTEEERSRRQAYELDSKMRVLDEKVIEADRKQRVLDEKDIVAPVEHRKTIEQVKPREYIRVIEEVARLSIPAIPEKERRKIVDVTENRKPVKRVVVREEQVRMPLEHRKIIEEVWMSENVRVVEEKTPLGAAGVPVGQPTVTEVKSDVALKGAGTRSYKGTPKTMRILDEYDVPAAVEIKRRVEEIEVVEIHRFIEERELIAKPILDEDVIKRHHSKKH